MPLGEALRGRHLAQAVVAIEDQPLPGPAR